MYKRQIYNLLIAYGGAAQYVAYALPVLLLSLIHIFHTFYVGKNAKVTYIEKHYGEGEGRGKRILNPQTIVYLEEGASIVMETSQIAGVDDTKRYTKRCV